MARRVVFGGLCFVLACVATPARADLVFNGSSGNLQAQASFSVVTLNSVDYLQVILTNTSSADVMAPSDVLTGVFFNWGANNPSLTPYSADLTPGSTVLFAPSGGGGPNVGGEWVYGTGSNYPYGANAAISSSGLGLFGSGNFPNFTNLQGPSSIDGVQYGITSAGDNPLTGNAKVTGSQALIQNSVTFLLTGVQGLSLSDLLITDVTFQYGTSLTEPHVTAPEPDQPGTPTPGQPVPEPASLALFGLGIGALGLGRLRRW